MDRYYGIVTSIDKGEIRFKEDGKWVNCPTLMLAGVTKNFEPYRDHVWIKKSKRFDFALDGDLVSFTAREYEYEHNGEIKRGLRHIRQVRREKALMYE